MASSKLVFHRVEVDVLFGEDALHPVEHLVEVLLRVGDQFEVNRDIVELGRPADGVPQEPFEVLPFEFVLVGVGTAAFLFDRQRGDGLRVALELAIFAARGWTWSDSRRSTSGSAAAANRGPPSGGTSP
ncbi:hypothetical protein [Haloplanus litoreus]|uniref:Uncharacterized protein n=1 Tax=Haloplanus litoreus TaxID=767515 RepID=A0ABD6A5C1_9EURY